MQDDSLSTRLFAEFVERHESGAPVDESEFCTRAGAAAEELRARIKTWREFASLGQRLRPLLESATGSADAEPAAGARFRIVRELGRGGLSAVLLAEDARLARHVALKRLTSAAALSELQRAWIANEARSIAQLRHPGVVQVFEIAEADGAEFLVMEHIDGPALSEVLDALRELTLPEGEARRGQVPTASATQAERAERVRAIAQGLRAYSARARLLLRLAQALAYCHDQGVLHRDIKPGNVLLSLGADAEARPVLIDFGLAHVATLADSAVGVTARLVGTAPYVAPEQIESGRTGADPRTDQYQLGVLAYELFSLWNPFQRETRSLTLERVQRAGAPLLRKIDPRVPRELEWIVHKALERDPARRYDSVDLLAADLDAYLAHRPLLARAPNPLGLAALWLQRHRRGAGIAAGLLIAVLFAQAALSWNGLRRECDAIEGLRTAIATRPTRDPAEFETCGRELIRLRDRARDLRTRWLGDAAAERSLAQIESDAQDWRRRARSAIESEIEAARRNEVALAQYRSRWVAWAAVLTLDELFGSAEDSSSLRALRGLGTLEVRGPEGTTIDWLRHLSSQDDVGWRRVERIGASSPLPADSYRFEARTARGELVAQQDYDEPGDYLVAPRVLELKPPARIPPDLSASLSTEEIVAHLTKSSGSTLPPTCDGRLYISADLVRWKDLRAYLTEHPELLHSAGRSPGAIDWDRTARLTRAEVMSVCAWHGLRLPNIPELHAALLSRRARAPADGTFAEWLAGSNDAEVGTALVQTYEFLATEELSSPNLKANIGAMRRNTGLGAGPGEFRSGDGFDRGLAFRFAWGDGLGRRE
jgi:serine/threonine protein kinase